MYKLHVQICFPNWDIHMYRKNGTCLWLRAKENKIEPTMSLSDRIAETAATVSPKLIQLYCNK